MRTRRAKLIVLVALVVGALSAMFALIGSTPCVALTVRGFTVKRWSDDIAKRRGEREYVSVTIEFTNAGIRPITYWARYGAEYYVLKRTPTGWKEPKGGFICGFGRQQCTLKPSEAVTFEAVVDRETPCKVALNYSDGRSPSRFCQRLPRWLAQRLPWGKNYSTVTTDVIDPGNAAGVFAETEQRSQVEPEEVPQMQASASSGDAGAQFRMAGRYWTGTDVEKSISKALEWYEHAARKGHAEAAYNLATIHEHGLAGEVDIQKAIDWYRRAGAAGHEQARTKLQNLASK